MTFQEYHKANRERLLKHLTKYLEEKRDLYTNSLTQSAFERLLKFSTNGKMLRGGFVMFACEMFGGTIDTRVLNIAAAMELSQSGILIHDDIMDNDRQRRGFPTAFAQYEHDAYEHAFENPEEYGKSMAITLGDMSMLLTYELIGDVEVGDTIRSQMMHEYAHTMTDLTQGQFLDYHYGVGSEEQTVDDILEMYRLKTGSYTFTLPFILGAYLAKAPDDQIKLLRECTERLGKVFQIVDDQLNLFGNPEVTGKPRGSDISENKKTLVRAMLMEHVGNQDMHYRDMDVETVCALIEERGVKEKLQKQIDQLSTEALAIIEDLTIDVLYLDLFKTLVEYNATRNR
jgi:geranylgeranyl diphosphate synthase type I